MSNEEKVDLFLRHLKSMIILKAKMYDGLEMSTNTLPGDPVKRGMFSVIEELGEVSSALTRGRIQLALDECVDVAHSAMLLSFAIEKVYRDG